jgi:PKD repeat protein
MKKQIIILAYFIFFILSCKKEKIVETVPFAGFTYTILPEGLVQFQNTSLNATRYEWNFGNYISREENPKYTFKNGIYGIKLTAFDAKNKSSLFEKRLVIDNIFDKPEAIFEISLIDSGKVVLKNTSMFSTKYDWDFGDGTKSTLQIPNKRYTLNKSYTITLSTTNDKINTPSVLKKTIEISNIPPTAAFTFSGTLGELSFLNQSINATKYEWNFGDGTPIVLTDIASHKFTKNGSYEVSLKALNASSYNTIKKTIKITDIPVPQDCYPKSVVLLEGNKLNITTNSIGQPTHIDLKSPYVVDIFPIDIVYENGLPIKVTYTQKSGNLDLVQIYDLTYEKNRLSKAKRTEINKGKTSFDPINFYYTYDDALNTIKVSFDDFVASEYRLIKFDKNWNVILSSNFNQVENKRFEVKSYTTVKSPYSTSGVYRVLGLLLFEEFLTDLVPATGNLFFSPRSFEVKVVSKTIENLPIELSYNIEGGIEKHTFTYNCVPSKNGKKGTGFRKK